jgi:hypothetical protein
MGQTLEGLAWAAVARGEPQQAVRLAAASEVLRQPFGETLMPFQAAGHAQAVLDMRASLDDQVFAALWAEGLALSPDEVDALALNAFQVS